MGFGFRKSWRLGAKYLHVRANASKAGLSWSIKVGPWSFNTRTRQNRVDLPGPLYWSGKSRSRRH